MTQNDLSRKLENSSIIVATHVYGTGASQDLVRYLVSQKAQRVLAISHPLFYDPNLKGSGYEVYQRGKKVSERKSFHRKLPLFSGFFLHMAKSLLWVLLTKNKWDLYIGSNNLNAFVGLLLKRLGKVKRVVYYVIDFNPTRFNQPLLNRFYQWLDQFCVLHADETWNLSPRMIEGRMRYFHFTGGQQRVVPVGIWKESLSSVPYSSVRKHTLAFLGHVIRKQGVQHVFEAIPFIVPKIRDFQFLVIGGGEYIDELRRQAKRLKIEKYVIFTDFIADHRKIDSMLSTCAAGIALYNEYDGNQISFTYFTEPTKIKSYLAAGLCIFVSAVPYNAKEIEEAGCGLIISYDPHAIADAIVRVLGDEKKLRTMRDCVQSYRDKFDWEEIFGVNLARLLV